MDGFGAAALVGVMLLLAVNQVVVKLTAQGLQPVFMAGLRSAGSVICVLVWLWWRGVPITLGGRRYWGVGLALGLVFAGEFVLLFIALDLTTVSRSSILFYAMPLWMALGAHLFLPGDRLTRRKLAGLMLAMAGIILALSDPGGGQASLRGDVLAVFAGMAWAAIGLLAKGSRLKALSAEVQQLWQVAVSAPVLLLAAPMFGPLVRDFQPIHVVSLLFQSVVVASLGFIVWFWLLARYPGSGVAAFSFLAPVFGVFLGWALLGENVGTSLVAALGLVAAGIALINWPRAVVRRS